MTKRNQHVVPKDRRWAVRSSGASRASRVFQKQSAAVTYARHLAQKESSEVYIHRRDGTIRQRDSYGSDPVPPTTNTPITRPGSRKGEGAVQAMIEPAGSELIKRAKSREQRLPALREGREPEEYNREY